MSKALYRKYRSKKLSEIVGQEHITKTLDNALKTGKISHAYLFTGPRGVGKTSIARILAHEINELPYTDDSTHLDIIEIDAASNRRIDEIRDLREKVHVSPTSAKYKVYIIDEVHMLTKEAFNALLKTLEEPPAHVVFILATTELHKLPETIISRTQRFNFKLIDDSTVAEHLKQIAKSEGMDIEDEAVELLARHGRGSFRDSISLLDQVGNSAGKVTRRDAERLIGVAASDKIDQLMNAIREDSPEQILKSLDSMAEEGVSPTQTAKQLSQLLRKRILSGDGNSLDYQLLGDLLEVGLSIDPRAKLEVTLLKASLKNKPQPTAIATVIETKIPEPEEAKPIENMNAPEPEEVKPKQAEQEIFEELPPKQAVSTELNEWWDDVLKQVKTINNTLYGAMRMATPSLEGEKIRLGFKFKLHASKVSESSTQAKIREVIHKVTGTAYGIEAVVDKELAPKPLVVSTEKAAPEPENNELNSIKNIFGGGEVLES